MYLKSKLSEQDLDDVLQRLEKQDNNQSCLCHIEGAKAKKVIQKVGSAIDQIINDSNQDMDSTFVAEKSASNLNTST
jgi:hypothetical protein